MDCVEPEGFRWVNRTWSYACEANSDVMKCAELSFVGFCRMAVERVSPQRKPQNQAGNSGWEQAAAAHGEALAPPLASWQQRLTPQRAAGGWRRLALVAGALNRTGRFKLAKAAATAIRGYRRGSESWQTERPEIG